MRILYLGCQVVAPLHNFTFNNAKVIIFFFPIYDRNFNLNSHMYILKIPEIELTPS